MQARIGLIHNPIDFSKGHIVDEVSIAAQARIRTQPLHSKANNGTLLVHFSPRLDGDGCPIQHRHPLLHL